MKRFFRRHREMERGEKDTLEAALQQVLIPVLPTQGFVEDLQFHLLAGDTYTEMTTSRWFEYVVLTTGIFVGVSFILVTLLRLIIGLVGFIDLTQKLAKSKNSPLTPV